MRILRSVINSQVALLGFLKRRQRVAVPKGLTTIKVNIGCGLAIAPGWVNIDGSFNALVSTWPQILQPYIYRFSGARLYYSMNEYCRLLREHIFIHHDLSYGLPLNDLVADFFYSSHFIEHLYQKDALFLVKEMHRVLKPGGILRISVPDLEYAISLYQSGKKEQTLLSYFFVEDDDSYYSRHKFMYDYEMLAKILQNEGFQDIRRCHFGQGFVPDIEFLDNRPDDSLFIEAKKDN